MKNSILLLFFLAITISVNAQAPQAISYQAIARDNSGNPLTNRNIGVRISILQGSASGSSVYIETHNLTTNQFGLFNLEIGRGVVQTGTFSSINWGNNSYFTKVDVDQNGGTSYQFVGTSQLLSVPYALYANKSNESQMLSISGNNLTISSGNTVTLPSSNSSTKNTFQQILNSPNNSGPYPAVLDYCTSSINNDSFLLNAYRVLYLMKCDPNTGQFFIDKVFGFNNQPTFYTSAVTHQGKHYCIRTQNSITTLERVDFVTGISTTINVVGATLTSGKMFSDGTFVYIGSGGNSWTKYSVSGNTFTNAGTLVIPNSTSTVDVVMYDGQKLYHMLGGGVTIQRVNLANGVVESSYVLPTSLQGQKGLVDGGLNKLYIVKETSLGIVFIPISKP